MGNRYNQEYTMLTVHSPIRWALSLLGRLHIAARLGLVAEFDATISNVSPPTPICRGGELYARIPWGAIKW